MADQWGMGDAIVKPNAVEDFGGSDQIDQHNPLRRGWNKMTQSVGLTGDLATGDYKGAASRLAEIDDYQRKNPGTPEGKKLTDAWNKGDGISGGLTEVGGAIAKDWNESSGAMEKLRSVGRNVSAMGQGVLEQTPNMAAPMAGMLAGGAAGSLVTPVAGTLAGGWAGASLGNTAVEGGGMTQEAIQKAGIDPTDKAATEAFLKDNGDKLLGQAGVKGSIIGAVDTATMKMGHGLLTGPANKAASRAITALGLDITDKAAVKAASGAIAEKMAADPIYAAAKSGVQNIARNVGAAALEPAGEFAGEYVGQGVATGDWDTKNAFLEAASSIGQGAATFAGQKLYAGMSAPFGNGDKIAPPTTPGAPPPNLTLSPQVQLATVQSEEMGTPDVAQSTPPDGRAVLNAQQEQQRQQREAQLAAQRAVTSPDDEILASTGVAQPIAKPSFSGILDTDAVYSGWSNVQDGSDRATMRDQMDYVAKTYGPVITPENREAVKSDLSKQFKWFRAASNEQKDAALNALTVEIRPSQAMGINPTAGVISAVAAQAVDSGHTQEIQLNQANQADQAAYDQQATEQDSIDKPITTGPIAESQMSDEDKRAVLFSNQAVADGGAKYEGTQDGDVLNGMGAPFKTRFAAARRAKMEGNGWTIAPVFDGFVARRKDAPNVSTDNGSGVQSLDSTSVPNAGTIPTGRMGDGASDGGGSGTDTAPVQPGAVAELGELSGEVSQGAVDEQNTQAPAAGTKAETETNQETEAVASDAAGSAGISTAGSAAKVQPEGVKPPQNALPDGFKKLLSAKSNTLISDDGRGRKLFDVKVTPEFRAKYFVNDRMPRTDGLELKNKADVTGNVYDKGYVLIDSREQFAERAKNAAANTVSQPAQPVTGQGAGVSQPTQGASPLQQKALARIAKGTAYFSTNLRAAQFITESGLKGTHEVVKHESGANRWDVRAKATIQESSTVQQPQEQPSEKAPEAIQSQAKPEAGPTASIPEPAAVAGVGSTGEVTKPSLRKAQAKRAADKAKEAPTVESVARAVQQKIAANRRKAREKSRKEYEAKGWQPNSTPESEQADYDAEIGEAPGSQQQKSASAILGNDPVSLIEMFVHGNFEASEDVFRDITGVKIRGLSVADKKAALYKWANWTPEQIAKAEADEQARNDKFAEKNKQEDAKTRVMGEWAALVNLNIGEPGTKGIDGQEFVLQSVAKGYDKAHSQKKGVATIYGLTNGKEFTTLKNGAFTDFVKAAIAFGGLDKTLEYVNPPKPQKPAGFVDRSVYIGQPDSDAGMIAKAFAPPTTPEPNQPQAPANTAQPAIESVAKPARQYHLVAVNEKTGAKTTLTRTPVTHAEAVTMKGKFDDKPGRRIQLEDVTPAEPASNPLDVPTDAQTQETGEFGPILTQYKGDAQGAIKALTELQDGEAVAALHHQEVGDIDLVWGKPPSGKQEGFGLAKISIKHPEVLADLQGFLNGLHKDVPHSGVNRIRLVNDAGDAVVSLDWKGEQKVWLLTAYKKGAEVSTTMDTADIGTKGDTARLGPDPVVSVHTVASEVKAAADQDDTEFLADPETLDAEKIKAGYAHRSVSVHSKVEMERNWYVDAIKKTYDYLLPTASNPAQLSKLKELLRGFRDEYRERRYQVLDAGASAFSVVAAGRHNFNHKASDRSFGPLESREKAFNEWLEKHPEDMKAQLLRLRTDEQKAEDYAKAEKKRVNALTAPIARDLAQIMAIDLKQSPMDRGSFVGAAIRQIAKLHKSEESEALRQVFAQIAKWDATHAKPLFSARSPIWLYKPASAPESKPEADTTPPANDAPADVLEAEKSLWGRLNDGTATIDEFKAGFENWVNRKDEIVATLMKNTKDQLLKMRGILYDRYKNEPKAELVDAMWRDGVTRYVLARSFQHGMGKNAWLDGIRNMVNNTDADQLAKYAEEVKANTEEAIARIGKIAEAIKDPKTLEDYITWMRATIRDGKTFKEARMMLTVEQRAQFDELTAADSRSKRKANKDEQRTGVSVAGQTVDGNIIATKHTKNKTDLFVVQLAERVSKEDYNTLNAGAKRIGGYYSSFRGAGAVPGFTFTDRAQAEAFVKLAQGDNTEAKAAAQANRDSFEDDRSQTAVQRLTEMADRLEDQADASLNQDRKTNTNKRASQAASAESAANADKAMAKTMHNIATAIGDGTAKFLDRVRQKTQVSLLQGVIATAKYDELRAKYESYSEQERHKGEPPTAETTDFATFPTYTASRSNLATLARQLQEVDGTKLLGNRLLKEADDVTDAYMAFAKENFGKVSTFSSKTGGVAAFKTRDAAEAAIARSGYKGKAIVYQVKRGEHTVIMSPSEAIDRGIWNGDGDKRITLTPEVGAELVEKIGKAARRGAKVSVPWQLETAHDRRKALTRMGIETPAEFRAALREFIGLQEQVAAPNKVKELERAMIGRSNDGMDFFPTPESVAEEMVSAAGIEPGMAVLEPSAGWGHIAERIRAAGVAPDVGEISGGRRELLEAKGFNVVGRDFMEMSDGQYDRILMNPPFSDGRDIQHVQHAYTLLKPGGRIVAIMGESAFTNQNKRATEFREWLESVGGTEEKLPDGSFNDPSLPVNTGANARLVVIEKSTDDTAAFNVAEGKDSGYTPDHEPTGETESGLRARNDIRTLERAVSRTERGAGADRVQPYDAGVVRGDETLRSIAEAIGLRYRWFDLKKGLLEADRKKYGFFNGAYLNGTVFLRATGNDRPHLSVLGHELAHEIARTDPVLYEQFAKAVFQYVNQQRYADEFVTSPVAKNAGSDATILEEFMGEVLSDGFMDKSFWVAINKTNPSLFDKIRSIVGNLIDTIKAKVGYNKRTARILTDYDRVMQIAGEAVGQYAAKHNPDGGIKFNTIGDTLSSAGNSFVVPDVKKLTNRLADFRGIALQALGRRQLVDIYTKDLPQIAAYSDMVAQMDADKNESGAEADALANEWGALDGSKFGGIGKHPGMERKLAELMHDATLAKIDPDKDFIDGDDENQYEALKHGFEQLSDEAKVTYRKARDMYSAHNEKVREAIRERIERSELSSAKKKALLEKMDGEFFQKVKGVYFPLSRFGQYLTIVKDDNGTVMNVSRSETLNEADETRKILLREYPAAGGFMVGKVLKEKEFNAARDGVGRGFMADLFETLEKTDAGEELIDSISQLYLAALPDLSWAKHGIHRKGTPGFSQDARRAFAQNMFHGARYLAKLRYADQLQTYLDNMQEHVGSKSEDAAFDSVKAQQVVDEMVKRHDSMMNPQTHPISTALTSFGFVFHLGLSPASALVNLSQTALVALPIMGAKWGFTKSSAALLTASKQTMNGRNDLSKVLKGDELRAYNEAVRTGAIDVTMAHDLAGIAQGEDSKVAAKIRPVMKWASFLFHHAEKFNRQVTFVAAYRLSKEAGSDHTIAYAEAIKAMYEGHFDYSASNRARLLQGNWQKVILLFKQYAQNMIYTLSRQAYQAVKAETGAERAEARKALSGLLVSHAMAAGVFGLPMVGMLLSAASMIGGDDDEPWDAKVALQNMLADTLGQKPAEVIAHGLSRLTPWDISGRVGLDKLLLPDIQEGLSGTPAAQAMLASAAGPVAGIGVNFVKGLAEIGDGQYQRGFESMLPSALRGPLKAYRYAAEGNIDKSGVPLNDEVSTAGIVGQALGLSPSETRLAQEGKSAIYSANRAIQERRSDLMRTYAMASIDSDAEGMAETREQITRFNEKNQTSRIMPMHLMASVRARKKRIEESKQGVYLPKKRQDAMEAGRFAVVD